MACARGRGAWLASMALFVLLAARRGAADDLSLIAQPQYRDAFHETTDQANNTTNLREQSLIQQYRLSLEKQLVPALRFYGSGILDDWRPVGASRGTSTQTRMLDANLAFGDRMLNGVGGYNHREAEDRSPGAGNTQLQDAYTL